MNFVRSNNGGNYANNYRTSRMQDMSITVHELSIVAIFVPGKTRRKATATAKATKAGTNKTEGRPPAKFRFGEKKRTKERDREERILIRQ